MATLLGIAYRAAKRAPMQTLKSATLTRAAGVHTDFRGRPGKRQVALLSLADWTEACAELAAELDWTTRRSNLLIDELAWPELVGRQLRIGTAIVSVHVEIDPCSRMDEAHSGLAAALTPNWRGGAGCRVLSDGNVCVGDTVSVI